MPQERCWTISGSTWPARVYANLTRSLLEACASGARPGVTVHPRSRRRCFNPCPTSHGRPQGSSLPRRSLKGPGERLRRSRRPNWSVPFSPAFAASQGERGAPSRTRRCPRTGQKLCQWMSTIASATTPVSSVCPGQVARSGNRRQRVSTARRTRGGIGGLLVRVQPGELSAHGPFRGPLVLSGQSPGSVTPAHPEDLERRAVRDTHPAAGRPRHALQELRGVEVFPAEAVDVGAVRLE